MTIAREIAEKIKEIAGTKDKKPIFFSAEVVEVDAESCTVNYNDIELTDVRLAAVVDGQPNAINIQPTVGCMVLVADLSMGELRDCAVIGWSEVDSISWMQGKNGGLVKVDALMDFLQKVYADMKALSVALPPIGATFNPQTPMPQKKDFENDKIKH